MKAKQVMEAVLAAMMLLGAAGCGSSEKKAADSKPAAAGGSITGSGSSALLPLMKDAAAKYKAKNKDVTITLNAGGSGTGLKQVSDGSVDMGNSDVPAESKLPKDKAAKLKDHRICVMTVVPILNKDVKVKSLTKQQLADIFTRPKTSGTRALFKKYAINGVEEADNKSLETDNSGVLLKSVASNAGAIGYVALPYVIKDTTVEKLSIDGVAPTLENTYSGKYPVWGFEHVYTAQNEKPAVKAFLDYVLGEEYGKRIEELGYGVSSKMQTKEVH